MIKRIFCILSVLQICMASVEAIEPLKIPSRYDPQGVEVVVEDLPVEESREWDLQDDMIKSKIEQELMRLRLEPSNSEPEDKGYLYANVNLVGHSYSVKLSFRRRLTIKQDGLEENMWATVWFKSYTGYSQRYNNQPIYESLIELTGLFSTEYIKQNRRKQ